MSDSTANDRFKAQWDTLLAWSVVAAVCVHVVGFVFSPDWMLRDLAREPAFALPAMEWLLLQPPGQFPGMEAIAVAAVAGAGADSLGGDIEDQLDSRPADLGGSGHGGLSGSLLDRLLGRSAPRPVLTEPELEPVEPEIVAEADGDQIRAEDPLSIGGNASTASLESLPDPDALDLARLSVLEPELSLTSLSAWVLVRNPEEVVEFMRRSAALVDLGEEDFRTVRVTLWIDRTGSVEWSEVMESSGDLRMDELALELINEVVSFRPAREQGVAVARSAVFIIPFPWT